jgi:autotransporter-associated beta strand protein
VIAQSIGGGGGIFDGVFSGTAGGSGAGGAIALNFDDDVLATGAGSTAIVAQSLGTGSSGNIDISLGVSSMVVGGVNGTGIAIAGGGNNTVVNRNLLATMSGVDGMAISATDGTEAVDNFGTIVGSIDLGSGVNTLMNRSDAWLSSGRVINVGTGTFTNAGTFDPGASTIMQTALTGNFAQEGRPTWFVDLGEVGTSDALNASGRGDLGSSVTTVNLHTQKTPKYSGSYTILSAAGGGLSGSRFTFGSMDGAMPIGKTFTFAVSDTRVRLKLRPSDGVFYWDGAVSRVWSDPFINGRSNWTREPHRRHIFGTPGAASDVIFLGNSTTFLGADFTIGSLSGTGIVSLDNHTLTTGANGSSTTWAGSFAGSGHLVKTGTGTFTLSGLNVFDGSTTVAGGRLLVDGWLMGNPIHVLDGARLGGNGLVADTTIERGGILSPGASIGTLTVDGDLRFDAGSIYEVETLADGSSDLTWVTGSLLGSGATVRITPGGDERYHPITMFGIMGVQNPNENVFSNVISDAAYLDPSLQYDGNGMYLTLRRNDVDFRSSGTQGNQTAVAESLNGLVRTAIGSMADVINNVYDLSNDEAVRAIGSMTGVVYQHTASSSFAGAQTFMDATMTHMGQQGGRAEASRPDLAFTALALADAPAADAQGAWFSGIGGLTRLAGGAGDPAARVSSPGFAAGYDRSIGDHLIVGASGGQSSNDLDLVGVDDRSTSSLLQGALYGRYTHGASRLAIVAGGGRVTNDTTRQVTDGFGAWGAHSTYDGSNLFGRIEFGRTLPIGPTFSVEPQAGFQYVRVSVDGFTEDGADALNLMAPGRHLSSQRALFGARAVKTFGAETTLDVRAAWAHEFSPFGSMRVRFLGDNAANAFDITSPARIHNSAIVGGTVTGRLFRGVRFLASAGGDLSGAIKLWTASVGLRAQW